MNYRFELRPETIKRLEENTGESSLKLVLAVNFFFFFFDTEAKATKEKMNKWTTSNLKASVW